MIRIRISRRFLRGVGTAIGGLVFLLICYLLGIEATPRDRAGRPLLLSPSVYEAEVYRRAALRWVAEMEEMDRHLTTLLAQDGETDPARLYELSRRVEEQVARSVQVQQEVAFTPPSPALLGLAEQLQTVVEAYRQATQAAARWVGAPEPENRRAALEALRTARGLRTAVEESAWLNEP